MLDGGGEGKGRAGGMPRHRRHRGGAALPTTAFIFLAFSHLPACRRQGLCGMPGLEELQRCGRAAQCRGMAGGRHRQPARPAERVWASRLLGVLPRTGGSAEEIGARDMRTEQRRAASIPRLSIA